MPAGGKEGSKPSGVCETFCTTLHAIFLHAKNHAIKVMQEFMQELMLASSTSRRGATDDGKRASSAIEVASNGRHGLLGGGWEGDRCGDVKTVMDLIASPLPLGTLFSPFFRFFFRVFRRSPFLTEKSHIFWQCCRFFGIFPPLFDNFWSILGGPGGIFWCNFSDEIKARIFDSFFPIFSVF